jgi:endonuclease/exonuclease/phosphatase (EEP) superfamily protein YafD
MPQPKLLKSTLIRWLSLIACFAIVGITAIALLSPRLAWRFPWEILSHFQAQYFIVVLLFTIGLALARRKRELWIGLACCAILTAQILPWYLPPRSLLPQPEANLRVLVANLNTQNHSHDQVLALVKKEKPDIAVFMEVGDVWVDQLNTLSDLLPYSFGRPNPYNLGLMVYSKQPLSEPQIQFFGVEKNISVVGQLAIAGKTISLIATHPLPPAKASFFHLRNRQLEQVSQYIKTLSTPVVMVGDLNLSMWSPYYRRLINQTGFKNARQGFGILPTWPTHGTFIIPTAIAGLFSIPLDHCLLSPSIRVTDIRTDGDTGSDHRPVIVDLRVAA